MVVAVNTITSAQKLLQPSDISVQSKKKKAFVKSAIAQQH
jgi:hypothetical protein